MKPITFAILLLTASLAPAQEDGPVIPAAALTKALQWMQHEDPSLREAAYRSFKLYGKDASQDFQRTLAKAQRLHEKKLDRLLNDDRANPFSDLDLLADELKSERERIYKLIKTDFQKKGDKIRMLIKEVEGLQSLNEKIRKIAAKDSSAFEKKINSLALAMAEVQRELRYLEGEEAPEEDIASEESLAAVLNETFEGESYLKTKDIVDMVRKEVSSLKSTNTLNDSATWASASQKTFSNHLNQNRSLFGLGLYLMEERLSAASTDHSADMAKVGFFSHTSPVEGKSSPADRARLAKFQHRWTGENIFMGSSSPTAAYDAWFTSDGHRFIMFAKGPNLIGIGPHGKHWTMMTGSK